MTTASNVPKRKKPLTKTQAGSAFISRPWFEGIDSSQQKQQLDHQQCCQLSLHKLSTGQQSTFSRPCSSETRTGLDERETPWDFCYWPKSSEGRYGLLNEPQLFLNH